MKKIRVLLADDHRIFLEGLKKLLEGEFDIADAVEDGRALVQAAVALSPDVIVADVSMPSLNGLEAARQLSQMRCEAKLIFLTMHGDPLLLRQALIAGAAGYILKRDAPDVLVSAIRQVMRGKLCFTQDLLQGGAERSAETGGMSTESQRSLGKLTARQREILQMVAEGRTAKEIASAIDVTVKTVEFHKSQLMQRLGVRRSAELTAIAIRHGLITP
jgi:DNA-binding NarL/FixJ family response regulator